MTHQTIDRSPHSQYYPKYFNWISTQICSPSNNFAPHKITTEQMLLFVLQEWKTKLDQAAPCNIGVITLDFQRAFGTVNLKLCLRCTHWAAGSSHPSQ